MTYTLNHPGKTLCPRCGKVRRKGRLIARAETALHTWFEKGYVKVLCSKCEKELWTRTFELLPLECDNEAEAELEQIDKWLDSDGKWERKLRRETSQWARRHPVVLEEDVIFHEMPDPFAWQWGRPEFRG